MTFVFLIYFVRVLGSIFTYCILGRIIFSWLVMGNPKLVFSKINLFLIRVTEPIFILVRKLPHRIGMLDLSPVIAIFMIDGLLWLFNAFLLSLFA